MLTKSALTVEDLLEMFRGLYEMNQRGAVFSLVFFDADGKKLPVSWVEVAADDRGLVLDPAPGSSPLLDQVYGALGRQLHGG